MDALILRGVFAAAKVIEVRFAVGLLDDFSLMWDELPYPLKEKWAELASGLHARPLLQRRCICGGELVDASTRIRMVKCATCGRMDDVDE